jgi:hypothetical protein
MNKEKTKTIGLEIIKAVFEFLIFRWGRSYGRISDVCTGKCLERVDGVLEGSKLSLERANKNLGRILDDAEKIVRHDFSKDKKE